jgi:hypothetical protein
MADRIEVFDGTGYLEQGAGPDGPTHFVRLGSEWLTPRAAGDLIADPNVSAIDWDTGWLYPTLLGSWTAYNAVTHVVPRYRKAAGVVTVEGMVKGGTIDTDVFVFPPGYRSRFRLIMSTLSVDNAAPRRIDLVNGSGQLTPKTGSNGWVSLQLTFFADA